MCPAGTEFNIQGTRDVYNTAYYIHQHTLIVDGGRAVAGVVPATRMLVDWICLEHGPKLYKCSIQFYSDTGMVTSLGCSVLLHHHQILHID
jgi:hypothetical protein